MRNKLSLALVTLFSFLGFLDLTYLTILHYQNIIPPCHISTQCEQVLTSQYSVIFGIPTALLGALSFLSIVFLSLLYFELKKEPILKLLKGFVILNFSISFIFFLIQAFILKAFCQYCLFADLMSLFVLLLIIYHKKEHKFSYQVPRSAKD